ncbi:MAG TPA: hypothetical protein ENI65_09045 [Gammaproteobacteria bacterium]|nr:hypothetical protein [Gammaproteobacteria bacterium]
MNKQRFIITVLSALVFIAGCSTSTDNQKQGDLMLMYQESENGVEPYASRVLVTDKFLRLDDGYEQSDFTLYDRSTRTIYTVLREEQSIMKLKPVKTSVKVEKKLLMDARKLNDKDIPSIEGMFPIHFQLLVNNKLCSDVFAVKGLHKKAVIALGEFRRTLAEMHLKNLYKTPEELRDDCFIAHDILSPSRTMQFGLPVYQFDVNGKKRMLVDYNRHYKSKPDLYVLPKNYKTTIMKR